MKSKKFWKICILRQKVVFHKCHFFLLILWSDHYGAIDILVAVDIAYMPTYWKKAFLLE